MQFSKPLPEKIDAAGQADAAQDWQYLGPAVFDYVAIATRREQLRGNRPNGNVWDGKDCASFR